MTPFPSYSCILSSTLKIVKEEFGAHFRFSLPRILSPRSRHFIRLRKQFSLKIVKEEIETIFDFRLP